MAANKSTKLHVLKLNVKLINQLISSISWK